MPGRGSVRKRTGKAGRVSWRVVYDLPVAADGKRRQASETFATKRAADQFLTERQRERDTGTALDPTRLTVAELVAKWIDAGAADRRVTTVAVYRGWLRNHIAPAIGGIPIQKLAPLHVADLVAAVAASGAQASHAHKIRWLLSAALAQAVEWRMLARNVAAPERRKRGRTRHTIPPHWDEVTARSFVRVAGDHPLAAPYLLMLATGLRRGELLALKWQDLDLDRATLVVARTRVEVRGAPQEHPPKGGKPRLIDLDPETVALLRLHRKRQVEIQLRHADQWEDRGFVFCDPPHGWNGQQLPGGRWLSPSSLVRRWYRLIGQLDVPAMSLHGLRHTHATLLLQQGVHPKMVQERLGHATYQMTIDLYSHVVPSMGKAAAEATRRALHAPDPARQDAAT